MPAKSSNAYLEVADDPNVEFRIVDDAAPFGLKPAKAKRGRKPKAKPAIIDNPSGIRPTEFKVLVKPQEIETVTKGGIILPMGEAEKLQNAATEGVIVAVSGLAFTYEKWPEGGDGPPKVGDRIVYSKYSGMKKKGKDGVEYILMNDKDIAAVLE
jgi:chaperonin GroES